MYTERQKELIRRYKERGEGELSYEELIELVLAEYAMDGEKAEGVVNELIRLYGELDKALDMSPEELMHIAGMNRNAAILLSMLPGLAEKIELSGYGRQPRLETYEKAERYARAKYYGMTVEAVFVFCLDQRWNLTGVGKLSVGTLDKVALYPREIAAEAKRYNAVRAIVTHNHPSNEARPSREDYIMTERIIETLGGISVELADHIIITPDDSYSFAMDESFSDGSEWPLDKTIEEKRSYQRSLRRGLDWLKMRKKETE